MYLTREGKRRESGARRVRAEAGGEFGGEVSGVGGALLRGTGRMAGGGVGQEPVKEVPKNESFSERTEGGGGEDGSLGVVSASLRSASLSFEEVDTDLEEEARDDEREIGGGGCSSKFTENGEPKKALVLLPLACKDDGDRGDGGCGASESADDIEEVEVRILRWDDLDEELSEEDGLRK